MNNILDWKDYSRAARNAAAEGCVLLRNEKQALPIRPGETVSVFGRIQLDYYKSGTGSGGMVNVPYVHSILDGLREQGILVRWFDRPRIGNYLRISVGTDDEMDALCAALKALTEG